MFLFQIYIFIYTPITAFTLTRLPDPWLLDELFRRNGTPLQTNGPFYDTYERFCKSYLYGYEYFESNLTTTFLHNDPFVIINCSRQNDSIKNAIVDVRLEFETKENMPMNIIAYYLIIYDRVVQYNPLTNVVRKIT